MARRTLPALTALTALVTSATLLLSACGGGGSDSSDEIEGAGKGSTKPSASPSKDDGSPDLSVPKDLNLVFDFSKPSDPKQAAAVDNAANYIRALKHGIAQQDENDPAYKYYSAAQAAQYAKTQIKTWVKGGWVPTGTDRYFKPQATELGEGKAVLVTFCRNQAKSFSKDIKGGKIHYGKESLDSYQKFSVLMSPPKSDAKVWKAQTIEVQGRVKECRG
ncbi:hypothetical protein AB0E78_26110 [Streptomyces sp. NPDC032198]|uniref:hypothetical protein n=1 Tax=Streptomyces sp. NPDC032198 TaxID=3155127 RepID=UPI0033FA9206